MTLEQIAERVRASSSDTAVAAAFRRALGIAPPARESGERNRHGMHGVYDGMAECFKNRKRVNQ